MKCLRIAALLTTTLIPALACAQNTQFTNCRSLELTGNFIGADEVLVDGKVCKVAPSKTNASNTTPAPAKSAEQNKALLGIIEPETLRLKEKPQTTQAGTAAAPAAGTVPAPGSQTTGGTSQPGSFASVPQASLGDIARAYRKDAAAQTKEPSQASVVEGKKSSAVAQSAPAAAQTPAVTTVIVESTPSAKTVEPRPLQPVAVKPEATPATVTVAPATSAVVPPEPARAATNSPAVTATSPSPAPTPAPLQTQTPSALEKPAPPPQPAASATPSAPTQPPALEPEPALEKVVKTGAFVVPEETRSASGQPQPVAESDAEISAFREGQMPSCRKNISLGSMKKDNLFLAIPEWALAWYGKNQRKFPGICFSNALMPGAANFLVVFYTTPAEGGSQAAAKATAKEELSPVKGQGSFTTGYGAMWHYTSDSEVTTTITSVSPEKAPHNQQPAIIYARAYTEQGIPVTQHWPAPITVKAKPKESSKKPAKNKEVVDPAFQVMAELLNQMVEDIAKL